MGNLRGADLSTKIALEEATECRTKLKEIRGSLLD